MKTLITSFPKFLKFLLIRTRKFFTHIKAKNAVITFSRIDILLYEKKKKYRCNQDVSIYEKRQKRTKEVLQCNSFIYRVILNITIYTVILYIDIYT